MKQYLFLLLTLLVILFSCKKDSLNSESANNTVTLTDGAKTYQLTIPTGMAYFSQQTSAPNSEGEIHIIKSTSNEIDFNIMAFSKSAPSATGDYIIGALVTRVNEKFSGGFIWDGKSHNMLNAPFRSDSSGVLKVLTKTSNNISGTFSFKAKNGTGSEKNFSGSFKFSL